MYWAGEYTEYVWSSNDNTDKLKIDLLYSKGMDSFIFDEFFLYS